MVVVPTRSVPFDGSHVVAEVLPDGVAIVENKVSVITTGGSDGGGVVDVCVDDDQSKVSILRLVR